MGNLFRNIAAAPLWAFNRLAQPLTRRPSEFRILLLHHIPASQMPIFDALVARLARAGLLISPQEAASRFDGGASENARPGVLLTFDDGFASNFAVAEKILARHDAKALFFVCPGLINIPPERQHAAIARHIFENKRSEASLLEDHRLMTWDELGWLASQGHVVGCHTLHHRRLAGAPLDVLEDEIGGAARELRNRLSREPDWFAYPFGDIESIDAQALRVIGRYHRFCRSGIRGAAHGESDRLALFAEHVDLGAPILWRAAAAEGGLDFQYGAARARLIDYARNARLS
jgi:peptidoglycan/xylan/chitin deacetylase (PgdA/CDA1 family)